MRLTIVLLLAALALPLCAAEPEPIRDLPGGIKVDRAGRTVRAAGKIVFREGPLEFLACSSGTKEHESVIVLEAKPFVLHLAVLALNVKPGSPVDQAEKKQVPKGQDFMLFVAWTDKDGKRHEVPANRFVREVKGKKLLAENRWVFTGSRVEREPKTGRRLYMADQTGAMVSVYHDPTTMFDLPLAEADSDETYEANTEAIPPLNTEVELTLKVKPDKPDKKDADAEADNPKK